jgi:phosphoribosylanthranilate isomerase
LVKPLLKFCGNRSIEDWKMVIESKCDYIGLIFAKSKRRVTPKEVLDWLENYPKPKDKKLVGVFVNASSEDIRSVCDEVPLDIIQCHGNESPSQLQYLKEETQKEIWKVIHHLPESINLMKTYNGIADAYLIDSKHKGAWGGTGKAFDWMFIPKYMEEAGEQSVPCWIAGGVNTNNISSLLRYHPFGIDIASGIEIEEKKNRQLITTIEEKVLKNDYNLSR